MKIKGLIVLGVVFSLTATTQVSAHERSAAEQSVDSIKKLITSYRNGDVKQGVENALNRMVSTGVDMLRAKGYKQDAQRFSHSWQAMNVSRALDLGDHEPLNAWMANYYEVLAQRFGEGILKQLHLDDVLTLNYAIPVVFKPNGSTKGAMTETWDMTEYRKHFVPFSGIVTYWTSLGVCMYAAAQTGATALSENCGQIANLLSKGMVMYPAPKLSDWIFAQATHKTSSYGMSASRVLEKKDLEFLNEVLDQYN